MRFACFALLLILSTELSAQFSISGKVIDKDSEKPLASASVFLGNATKGTISGVDGSFRLTNIKSGQYDVVVSIIGYQTFAYSLMIDKDHENLVLELIRKPTTLKPVVVLPDHLRQRYMDLFKKQFIGRSPNSLDCKLLNPEILDFNYDAATDVLRASAEDFLIVENKALGYRIKFLLTQFEYNNTKSWSSYVYYEGQALFEELPGSNSKKNRWKKNRQIAYIGSSMHFFRAARSKRIKEEGFVMHMVVRKPNTERPPEEIIQSKLNKFRIPGTATIINKDSLEYWQKKAQLPKVTQVLFTDTLKEENLIKRTDLPGIYALKYENLLYVVYAKKKSEYYSTYYKPYDKKALPYTIMGLHDEYAFFDNNGIVTNPQALVYEGYWGNYGAVADMLPADFEPSVN
jgi:hypothetical protein